MGTMCGVFEWTVRREYLGVMLEILDHGRYFPGKEELMLWSEAAFEET